MNYKDLFSLPHDLVYLNCAYMSPILKSVEQKGLEALLKKRNPTAFGPNDYFDDADAIRAQFALLVGTAANNIAIVPSASYGLMTAVNAIPHHAGDHAIVVGHEFPSGYYAAERWCLSGGKKLITVAAPESTPQKGARWNEELLSSIQPETAFVLLSSVHWTDGTKFDLQAIGNRCKETNTFLLVDGTQSVGAAALSVEKNHIHALVCAGYKWLMGPYSLGVAYYSPELQQGKPIEETWMARSNAKDFANLTHYVSDYKPAATKYDMGEMASFNLAPMLLEALKQVNEWTTDRISLHTQTISEDFIAFLEKNNFGVEEKAYRSAHLFGFRLLPHITTDTLMRALKEANISVSLRGQSIRVSPHLYNTKNDLEKLQHVLETMI